MTRFPTEGEFAPSYFSTLSGTSVAGSTLGAVHTVAGLTWVANLAIYIPFFLPVRYPVRRLWVSQGATVTALNQDVGIYAASGERICSTGSVAKSGSAFQYTTLGTPVVLVPGRYYLAYSSDGSGANTVDGASPSATVPETFRLAGMLEESSAFPLPAAMTPVTLAHQLYPIVGFTQT